MRSAFRPVGISLLSLFAGACAFHPIVGLQPIGGEDNESDAGALTLLLLLAGSSAITPVSPDLVPGLALWLKADAIGQSDSTPVSTWPDSTTNGLDAAQGVAGRQPVYRTGIANGLPVVRFSPAVTPDYMDIPEFMDSANPAVFVVTQTTSTATNQRLFNDMGSVFAQWLWVGVNGSNAAFIGTRDIDNDQISMIGVSLGQFRILFMQVNGQTVTWSQDGTATSGSNSAYDSYNWNGGIAGPRIGTTANSATGNPVDGDIAEVIVYKSILTDLERQSVECHLSLKYAISVAQTCSGG